MSIEDLVNLAILALVIGVSTLFKGMRKLCETERLAMKVRRELQEFAVLFNYGAQEERRFNPRGAPLAADAAANAQAAPRSACRPTSMFARRSIRSR
ncbi:hypothetical protein HYPGJ_30768 [Hyphomicrobium sp. GJ21]|uniref:hypothetical protein n=1 Tax=Hyphomicrobium sp. GJ21 TaxID=113574 RepID=UPI000622C0FF|nr:hypothetical protein [Hyphomicrobium sp. GJ21]CEJ86875.1 hypothetical protein HYPGJ_30768 [Hyphomicrobium sp. GJ21]